MRESRGICTRLWIPAFAGMTVCAVQYAPCHSRARASVIPAHAGIQRDLHAPLDSCFRRNDGVRSTVRSLSFPRTRSCHSRARAPVIPAQALLSFPRKRESRGICTRLWIPAFAGMTVPLDSCFRRNDGVHRLPWVRDVAWCVCVVLCRRVLAGRSCDV